MQLSAELRTATGPTHAAIETLPLSQAMVGGTVNRDEYVQLLKHLLAAHRGWEPEAARHVPAWHPRMERVAALERDLIALGADAEPADHPAIDAWLAELRAADPASWVGVVYLFEGSRMGSMALARPVGRALGLSPAAGGLDYHLDGIADRVPTWQRLKGELDALPLTAGGRRAAVDAAVATFRMLYDVYAAPAAVAAG